MAIRTVEEVYSSIAKSVHYALTQAGLSEEQIKDISISMRNYLGEIAMNPAHQPPPPIAENIQPVELENGIMQLVTTLVLEKSLEIGMDKAREYVSSFLETISDSVVSNSSQYPAT